ncbi:hypothetical protein HYU13_06150 [Candidatus Woesearchaeota archaeon]|nr:hypothetical protein [Candidatus Woesearchaeota archaeon]
METQNNQKRQVAFKMLIGDIALGEYIREEGEWMPNYISRGSRKISRVNIMGIVVTKEVQENGVAQNIVMDDSSGRIAIRTFGENVGFDDIKAGDGVLVIGRPREYLNERYIVAEIIKKIPDLCWIELRKKEMGPSAIPELPPWEMPEFADAPKDTILKVYEFIRSNDKGEGIDAQKVLEGLGLEEDTTIQRMLAEGEIFEIRPGKLKVMR